MAVQTGVAAEDKPADMAETGACGDKMVERAAWRSSGVVKDKQEVVEREKVTDESAEEKEVVKEKVEKEVDDKEAQMAGRGWMDVTNDGAARARSRAMAQAGRRVPHTRAGSRERQRRREERSGRREAVWSGR